MEVPNKFVTQSAPTAALGRIITFISKIVNPLIGAIGFGIAGIMLTAMMFLTFADVVGRYFLNKPIYGSLEIGEYMMALLVGFSLGYCALEKGHIRVDLIMQFVSRKVNQWLNIFAYGSACIFYVFITWQSWQYGSELFVSKRSSAVLFIPTYPFVFAISICGAFLVLIFLRDFLKSLEEVSK